MAQISGFFATSLAVALGLAVVLAGAVQAQAPVAETEVALGAEDAPITVIEYASLTCHHCAAFHRETFLRLKSDYIDTGRVRYVFRDFPLDQLAFRAAILARCAGPKRYLSFVEVLLSQQESWSGHADPMLALKLLAGLGGISEERFDACFNDKELGERVIASRLEGEQRYDVSSTPTFFINGEKHVGALKFKDFDAILKPLLGVASAQAAPSEAAPASAATPEAARSGSTTWLVVAALLVALAAGGAFFWWRRPSPDQDQG